MTGGNGYEVREGQGALFASARKEGKQPDYRGNVRINGVLYRLAGWKRRAKSGADWLSLKAEPDQQQAAPQSNRTPAQPVRVPDEFNDDIPF